MNPAIVAVDDDPQVLAAVSRDIRSRYGADYRVVRAGSGAEALEATNGVLARGGTVAAFVSDQRMPEMTGTEFLDAAKDIFPEAKKVLLTAYADTEAAIQAINAVGLDHYLMKPWDPPEDSLYPVLDDLLDDWQATRPRTFDGIRIVDSRWSSAAYAIKDFLARNQIPYQFLDIEKEEEGASMVEAAGAELPAVFMPDGTTLSGPDLREVADAAGLQTTATTPHFDLIVLGAGPAGLAAGVYGGSEGLSTLVLEKAAVGGQAGTSSRIENYLGFPQGISGGDLARRAFTQAKKFGTE
ncbi:MAG: response regulator, partial [Acidimicrobiia bacterium]|nr:response regulator [Acidimicrobiia bacterium]